MTALADLARGAFALAAQPLPPNVAHHARRAMVDWFAAAVPGAAAAPTRQLRQALAGELGHGPSRLVSGEAAAARLAALHDGTAAHAVEVDDIYREAIYHPGAPTIAAALAAARAADADGPTLLQAVVVGYEVSTRIGATLGRAHYRHWHSTGTVGSFGAAAAAATLLGLDEAGMRHAMATAATFAAGLQQAFRQDSMSKPLHAGRAAEAGLLAAMLAQAGVTGATDVLDGDAGLGVAMADGPDWRGVAATMGRDFHITRITFKPYACCGHTFAAIDAALAAQARLGITADAVEAVEVHTYAPALAVAGEPDPRTPAQGRFSLPYVVAHALRFGSVQVDAFEPSRLADPATRTLLGRVRLAVDPALDAGFPGRRAARVRIVARDGRAEEVLQPTRKGDPECPLSDDELSRKALALITPQIGPARAAALLDRLWTLDRAGPLRALVT